MFRRSVNIITRFSIQHVSLNASFYPSPQHDLAIHHTIHYCPTYVPLYMPNVCATIHVPNCNSYLIQLWRNKWTLEFSVSESRHRWTNLLPEDGHEKSICVLLHHVVFFVCILKRNILLFVIKSCTYCFCVCTEYIILLASLAENYVANNWLFHISPKEPVSLKDDFIFLFRLIITSAMSQCWSFIMWGCDLASSRLLIPC